MLASLDLRAWCLEVGGLPGMCELSQLLCPHASLQAKTMVSQAIRAARWDPSQAAIASKILREYLPRRFPDSKGLAQALAKKLESK